MSRLERLWLGNVLREYGTVEDRYGAARRRHTIFLCLQGGKPTVVYKAQGRALLGWRVEYFPIRQSAFPQVQAALEDALRHSRDASQKDRVLHDYGLVERRFRLVYYARVSLFLRRQGGKLFLNFWGRSVYVLGFRMIDVRIDESLFPMVRQALQDARAWQDV